MKREGIKLPGHFGSWYVVDETDHNGETLYLLESEQWGDDAPAIIVDGFFEIIADEVWNGFEDLIEEDEAW